MERDDAVLAHTYGGVGDSAACALWSCCVRCVRVRPCDHEARSNVCSDNQGACWEYQKCVEPHYNDICARARVDEARRFMGETACNLLRDFLLVACGMCI
jgi:hypothetical protein